MAGYGSDPYGSGPYGGGDASTVLETPATPASTEPEYSLNLDMYNFLIAEIREQDKRDGHEFVKRYLKGLQRVWDDLVNHADRVPDLWSVTDCPDEFLQYLKWIVGWTKEPFLQRITDAIDDDALRRLIAASGALWKRRGPESEILNVLNLVTGGARARIWNWFDFRWVLDETELGEEHQGRDPWVINLPSVVVSEILIDSGSLASSAAGVIILLGGAETFDAAVVVGHRFRLKSGIYNGQSALVLTRDSPTQITLQSAGISGGAFPSADWEIVDETFEPDDDLRSNLRIMDSGALDRTLVLRVLRLMRATGERFEINYLLLLDLFNVEGDDTQWLPLASGNPTVADGQLQLTDDTISESTAAIVLGAASWTSYVLSARIRGHSDSSGAEFGLMFYYSAISNHYAVLVDTFDRELILRKLVGGTPTDIVTVDLTAAVIDLLPDVFYTLRVSVVPESGSNRILVYIDGAELINTLDAAHSGGSVGFIHDVDAIIEVDEVEAFGVPADTDELDINETP